MHITTIQIHSRSTLIELFLSFYRLVPDRVWNLREAAEKITYDVLDFDQKPKDDELWWNQASLTHLDLSSNVLTEISTEISNLTDLSVLNVSLFIPLLLES
jgi:Leucine-rich repeat (LRR) protein